MALPPEVVASADGAEVRRFIRSSLHAWGDVVHVVVPRMRAGPAAHHAAMAVAGEDGGHNDGRPVPSAASSPVHLVHRTRPHVGAAGSSA